MEYKRQERDNYTLHFIKTDRFKEISVSVRFTKKYDLEEGIYLKLLERVLAYGGTLNKTRKELARCLESLYKVDLSYMFASMSDIMFFEAKMNMINPKYTSMDMYEKSFQIFKEVLNSPKVSKNMWDKEVFHIEKENLITDILNVKDDNETYGRLKFDEKFYKGTPYEDNNYKYIDKFKSADSKKLYSTYKSLFDSFRIDVLVVGDMEEEIISSLVDDLLSKFKSVNLSNDSLYLKLKSNKYSESEEVINSSQSNLFVGLVTTGTTEYERNYVMPLYNAILGAMNNSVLFVKVREDNSLCYYILSTANRYTDTLVITSGISAGNYEKAKSMINECLEVMKNEGEVEKLLVNAKKTLDISFDDYYDNMNKMVSYYYTNIVSSIPTIEDRREKINNITAREVVEFASKVSVREVFLLKGEDVNEES